MSSFWTPSGEHEVPNEDNGGGAFDPQVSGVGDPEIDPETAAAMEQQLREAQEQLLSVPAGQIVANHVIGLFELAALHLRVDPPNLDEARLPIDAMGILVEQLGDQLPEHQTLAAALHQIRLAFVEVQNQTPDDET
ncbi:MAG: hypothetical protein CL414_09930 [Acidimicrobiaceae bacterium]|nr:hypothetical protein [Acidimicrobiaceae bacterium]MBO66272.1 hypothetical protein [Actinomycetota bacterium]MEC9113260.1 hypothetical protein [Actinomycetota bacterium]